MCIQPLQNFVSYQKLLTSSFLVLKKLEEENYDFFKSYNIRMRVKEQIIAFNYLVSQQAQVMQKLGLLQSKVPAKAAAPGNSNE
jgi:hypothetical protein